MDLISQLEDQLDEITEIITNTIGTLQRDAPLVQLSPKYHEPQTNSTEDANTVAEQPKDIIASLVKAVKQFDALLDALPSTEGGEELQLKQIAELQAENEAVGKELQREIEAAEMEKRQMEELFSMAADDSLNLKPLV